MSPNYKPAAKGSKAGRAPASEAADGGSPLPKLVKNSSHIVCRCHFVMLSADHPAS